MLTKAVHFLWGFCSRKAVEPAEAGIPLAPAVQGGGQTPLVNRLFSQELGELLANSGLRDKSLRSSQGSSIPEGKACSAARLPHGLGRTPGSAVRAEATARRPPHRGRLGWAGRGAGPVPPPRAPTCPPDLAAQSRGIAQLSLPVRPRRRSRPGRCPPPHARTPWLSGVAGPRDADGQRPSSAARGEASPARRGGRASGPDRSRRCVARESHATPGK